MFLLAKRIKSNTENQTEHLKDSFRIEFFNIRYLKTRQSGSKIRLSAIETGRFERLIRPDRLEYVMCVIAKRGI